MKVGIIGAGLQGGRLAPAAHSHPRTEVVVVSAAHRESAARLARKIRCQSAVGWRAVVERDDVDAVVVCTPPHLHAEISIAAMRRGKHVLCEKPLARTIAEAREMLAAARQEGVRLQCGFNHRFHPGLQQAHEWFEDGAIGPPLFLRCRYGICGRLGYEDEWRCDTRIVGGGQMMEQGIHAVDLARWFLGDFTEVSAFVETRYWPIAPLEDNTFALYRTRDGVVASIHSSVSQWKNLFSFELFGRDGYIEVDGLGGGYGTERAVLGLRDFAAPFGEEVTEFRGPDLSWARQWNEFVSAVEEGRDPLSGGEDGLEALRLVYAAYDSARRRKACALEREASLEPA